MHPAEGAGASLRKVILSGTFRGPIDVTTPTGALSTSVVPPIIHGRRSLLSTIDHHLREVPHQQMRGVALDSFLSG